jgi:Ring finger domain
VRQEDFCFDSSEHFSFQKPADTVENDENEMTTDSSFEQHVSQCSICEATDDAKSLENGLVELPYLERRNDLEEGEARRLSIDTSRTVPNCCAICLCSYEVGETVVWSSRGLCNHAFHLSCIVDWLTKMRDGTPCPCCRQEFTDLPIIPKKEEPVRNRVPVIPRTFDPRAIVFR